ncbi:hypothetical protein [Stappia sp.]|uniref:hypothetical protein n=1 Tax=Stappia sp. TaxID=1870903 RepID=UPI0025DD80B3|nr:hypothetical protein [Stappia sp.]
MKFGLYSTRPWTATGRVRLRAGWFGSVRVEIEEEREHYFQAAPRAEKVPHGVETRWRRANRHDVTRSFGEQKVTP